MTHAEVVERFASRRINRRTGDVSWRGSNISCAGRELLSYHWWPLAYHLAENLFLKQGDRYSISTSGHQALVQSCCDGPTVSFSALEAAGISPAEISAEGIADWAPDTTIHLRRESEDDPWIRMDTGEEFRPPNQGLLVRTRGLDTHAYWHVLGACLLVNQGDRYLCSLDESSYFVAKLGVDAGSVDAAFAGLKPAEVQHAEAEGKRVLRQGEWFFVDTRMTDRDLAGQHGWTIKRLRRVESEMHHLPKKEPSSNPHECRRLILPSGELFASGCVHHPDHRMLRLGNTWWRVHRNTEIQSWSQGGRFD